MHQIFAVDPMQKKMLYAAECYDMTRGMSLYALDNVMHLHFFSSGFSK
jgi:hypothetical protein